VRVAVRAFASRTREIARPAPPIGHNHEREVKHCADARVLSEAVRQIVVPARLEQSERLFEMGARFLILSGEQVRCPGAAMRDAGLRRIGPIRDVPEECRRMRPHGLKFAPREIAGPEGIIDFEPFGRAVVADR
jgi:hypothetical protein